MKNILDFLRHKVMYWSTSAAVTLVGVRMFTPNFADFIIDILSATLVWVAAIMSQPSKK
jgi:hypothetical protein